MKKILLVFTLCLLNQTLKAQDEFITIWQSTEEYPSIEIPTYDNEVYHYRVNWGDGSSTLNVNGDFSHEYAATGNYTVTITGVFPGINFGKIYSTDNPYNATGIVSIEQWGNNQWKSMQGAFYGQTNLVINANDIPDLSLSNSLSQMFVLCTNINNGSHNRWNEWDTSTITNMSALFYLSNFNQPIGNWDVSNVTTMNSMFRISSFNQDISNWNVSNVTNMTLMFFQSSFFSQDLSNWNVSNVTSMSSMFAYSSYNQNIENWDVRNVTNMSYMFSEASSFNQNLGNWNLTSISTMEGMFNGCQISETNYDKTLTGWKNNANTPNNITLGADRLNFCQSKIDRQFLIDTKGWTIVGDNEYCDPTNGFVTTWQSAEEYPSIEIPTHIDEVYDYNVNWGDGSVSNNVAGDISHVYAATGNYTVTITGVFPRINFFKLYNYFNNYNDKAIVSIEQWGNNKWKNMHGAFYGQKSLVINTTDIPNLTLCTNLSAMFGFCNTINNGSHNKWNEWNTSNITNIGSMFFNSNFNQNIGDWDVSNVINMSSMFSTASFNQDISNWDVSNVTNMYGLFFEATSFNQPLNNWNVGNVNNMGSMFRNSIFNQALNNWDVSNVTSISSMFSGSSFNQELDNWDVSNITDMRYVFFNSSFNQDINHWNVSNVTDMRSMFFKATSFNKPLNNWNVSSVENMVYMFSEANAFNQNINDWQVHNVTNMSNMFSEANSFNQNINDWQVHNVTNMSNMFSEANAFNQNLNNWNVSNVTDMSGMFLLATSFNGNISNWNVSNVTNMAGMFNSAIKFDQDINNWLVGSVTNMSYMFYNAASYNQPLNNWDVFNVTDMNNMFSHTTLFNKPLNNWYVNNVTDMSNMFSYSNFNQNINNWFVNNVTNMSAMFKNTHSYNQPLNDWDVSSVTNMSEMFSDAISFNQPLNNWNISNVTDMSSLFKKAIKFKQTLNDWNTGSATTMANLFEDAIAFNLPLNNWNTSNVLSMEGMFKNALTFNQDIGDWSLKNIESCVEMFHGVTLSNVNYEALLTGWNNQGLNQNIVFDGGNSNYFTNEAVAAKHNMITNDNWTITDGGKIEQIIWTGANSTDWNDAGNWDINRVPTQHENIILADVANAPIINTDENYIVNKLINYEALSISTNASLTVLGDINQKNRIFISSSATDNGSLIVKGNQISLNPADIIYERFVNGNVSHLISSPVKNFNINTFVADSPLTEEEQGNVKGLGFYDNHSNPNWSYYKVGDNPGNFIAGKGHSVNTSENTFLTFRGKLKTDILSGYQVTENFNGWNLVGNPYPAFINANTAANENANFLIENINDLDPSYASIYFYNPNTTAYEPIGNGLEARYIAPGQGFFVKSKNNGGFINIKKEMLTHQTGNLFLKEIEPEKIVLQINDNSSISETTIAFAPEMTKKLDVTYDVGVFTGEQQNLSLYSHLIEDNNDIPFAIQFLSELGKYNSIVPLGISQVGFNEITLSLKKANISPSSYIYLEDKQENKFIEISTSTDYKFHLKTEAPETGRFFLHFQATPLSVNAFDASKINIYKDNNNKLQINGVANGVLNMYSITGQNILKNKRINSNSEGIQVPKIATGVYLLKINFEGKEYVQKMLF